MRVYRTMFQPTQTSMTWRITTQPGTELPRHIHHFDVSKRNNRLKNSSADIEIRFNLGSNFRNLAGNADQLFYVYAAVLSDRHFKLEGLSSRMNIIV